MNSVRMKAIAGLTFGLLASTALGQNTVGDPHRKENAAGWASFSKLLERAMRKVDEAVLLARKKRFSAAEAACSQAMAILEPAPFAQLPVKETLSQIYIEEGLYEEAVTILKPMYDPGNAPLEMACMLAISDCHTSRLAQAVDIIHALYRQDPITVWFADEAGLPMAPEITRKSVEATAYLFWGQRQPGSPKYPDGIERLNTAVRLAPKCGAAYYALASTRSYLFEPSAVVMSEGIVSLYRKAWELGDPFLRKQHFPIPVPPQK